MYSPSELLHLANYHFDWLQSRGFKISCNRPDRIEMESNRILFTLLFSADLPRLLYSQRSADEAWDAYDVWEFLVSRRREKVAHCLRPTPAAATITERNDIMLQVLSCALKACSSELLDETAAWKAEYK